MSEPLTLTPEQEALARRGFAQRRGFSTYSDDLLGPPPTPEVRAELEEMLRRDPEAEATDYDTWMSLHETNRDSTKQYEWLPLEADEQRGDSEEMRLGRVMHSNEFLTLLRDQCGLRCFYGDGQQAEVSGTEEAEAKAMGYESTEQMAEAGWAVKERRPQEGARWLGLMAQSGENAPLRFVCGVQAGWMAEYEVFHYNRYGLRMGSKYRGWRTVLLRLIMNGFVTEELAHQVFGEANAPCAARYNRMLHAWRNRPRQERAGISQVAAVDNGLPSDADLDAVMREQEIKEQTGGEEEPASRCPSCGRKYGNHNFDCPKFQAEMRN